MYLFGDIQLSELMIKETIMKKKKVLKETLADGFGIKDVLANEFYSVDDPTGILKENKLDFNKAKRHQASEKIRTTETAQTNADKCKKNVNALKKIIIDEFGGLAALEDKKTRKLIRKEALKRLPVTTKSINNYFRKIRNEGTGSRASFSDIPTCTVIRNGVKIPE